MIFRKPLVALSMLIIALLVIAASCSDEDRTPDARVGTGDGTPVADFGTPTGETDDGSVPGPDETVVPDATVPPAGEDDGTPSTSGLPAPEATGTPAQIAERTVTPDSDVVGPQGEQIFPDVREVPDLENFTLTVTGVTQVTEANEGNTDIDLVYSQSQPDVFHLRHHGDDGQVVEVWRDGDQMWILDGDDVTEASDELADNFDLAAYLSMLPDTTRITGVEPSGEEEIEGYVAQHYVVPTDDAISYLPGMTDVDTEDAQGSIEIWHVDDEDLVLRMVVNLRWTEADNDNAVELEFNVTQIGETEDIDFPES